MAADRPNWQLLREAFERYARGRADLLEAVGVTGSNRDPLAEFNERLVAALLMASWPRTACSAAGT